MQIEDLAPFTGNSCDDQEDISATPAKNSQKN